MSQSQSLVQTAPRPILLLTIIVLHLMAFASPFFFTWFAFALYCFLVNLIGTLGISVGYHRLLAHRSFKTFPIIENFLMLLGQLALLGNPIWWVLVHRLHHQYPDQELDPHSPVLKGPHWTYFTWMFFGDNPILNNPKAAQALVPDLVQNQFACFLAKNVLWVTMFAGLLLYALGDAVGGPRVGISCLLWGGALQSVVSWHVEVLFATLGHLQGTRRYQTNDNSHNTWWLTLICASGEAWHHNHHAMPGVTRFGHKWWEIDTGYWVICLMGRLGLAWDITPVTVENQQSPV